MLLERFDVAVYGPQTMAFPAPREGVEALTAALAALYEIGDATPYRRLWDDLVPRHLAKASEARWIAPSKTLERFCEQARATLPRGVLEVAEPALDATRTWLGTRESFRTHPESWFLLEHLQSYLEQEWTRMHPSLDALPDLLVRIRDERPPEGWLASAPPLEDLGWLRVYREVMDDGALRDDPAASVIPEWIEEPVDALDEVHRRSNLALVLAALVGPYVTSRGPGPFMGPLACSRRLEDPSWHWLRATGTIADEGRVGDARVLDGSVLEDALRETERATPSRAWWGPDGEITREIFDETYGTGARSPRLSWEAVQSEWPRCQARFLTLLGDARAKGEAVLLVPATISSQGPGTLRPVGAKDGALA